MTDTLPQTVEDAPPAVVQKMDPVVMLNKALESGADPAVIEKFMDLQERFEKNEAAKQYAHAMATFQDACPAIPKEGEVYDRGGNLMYKFAKFDQLMAIVLPILNGAGMTAKFSTELTEQHVRAECTIRCGIHTETSYATVPVPTDMSKINKSQQGGVAIAYAKRYAFMSALNLVASGEDKDGATPPETITEEQAIELQDIASQVNGTLVQKSLAKLKINTWSDLPTDKYGDVRDGLREMAERK